MHGRSPGCWGPGQTPTRLAQCSNHQNDKVVLAVTWPPSVKSAKRISTIPLVPILLTGPHTLTITRATEPRYGAVWLRDITLHGSSDEPGGVFVRPPAGPILSSGRRMLFIGDSYTAGAANAADKSCKSANAANSNALLAYGPVAACALRAEYQVGRAAWACHKASAAGGQCLSTTTRHQVCTMPAGPGLVSRHNEHLSGSVSARAPAAALLGPEGKKTQLLPTPGQERRTTVWECRLPVMCPVHHLSSMHAALATSGLPLCGALSGATFSAAGRWQKLPFACAHLPA